MNISPAADSCLQNPVVIEKILKQLSLELIEDLNNSREWSYNSPENSLNLSWRLVNSAFNSEVLHRIRTTHRSIQIEFRQDLWKEHWVWRNSEEINDQNIHVNDYSVKTHEIFDYIRFMSKVVNVKVEHFVMRTFWPTVSDEKWRKRLHDEIHQLLENQQLKTFVGMKDLCDGFCTKCFLLASTSSHYGPLQIGINTDSMSKKKPLHFQKLIVGERYLHGIASNVFMYLPAERCKQFIKYYLDPLISCDQLIFSISEIIKSDGRDPSQPLPLEVIEEMCDVWKPKSIGIEFGLLPQNVESWSDKGIFTPIRLDELYQGTDNGTDKKKRKFSSVTVDMTHSKNIYIEFLEGYDSEIPDENNDYTNLIANVRRVFPTDKIVVISHQLSFVMSFGRECFEKMLKSVWKNPGHLEVTIRHYSSYVKMYDDFEISDPIDFMGHRLECTLLPDILTGPLDYIGRTFRITDEIGEKTLNLELFIRKSWLEEIQTEAREPDKTPLEKGFLKHFTFYNDLLV